MMAEIEEMEMWDGLGKEEWLRLQRIRLGYEGDKDGIPFMPTFDPPVRCFQVLQGRVFLLQIGGDGETTRGELSLADLESIRASPVSEEGWYDGGGPPIMPPID